MSPVPDRFGWRGALLATLVVPLGAALAIGLGLAQVLEPRWTAAGWPLVHRYPKNVEISATLLAVGLGAATTLLSRWRVAWALAVGLAALGYAAAAPLASPRLVGACLPVLAAAALLAVGLERRWPADTAAAPAERWLAGGAVALFAGLTFVASTRALRIDLFHLGEVLMSALDLLAGGQPFVTFFWPHGLHDTGLTALWITYTGKIGTSPVALALATTSALAAPAFYLIARRATGAPLAAAVAVGAGLLALTVDGLAGDERRVVLAGAGTALFSALGFALARARPLAAGAALGAGHLFRIDASLYGLGAVLGGVLYRRAAARPALGALRAVAAVLGGAALLLLATRLAMGWPGAAWVDYVFAVLPRYHSIANGLAFPWPIARVTAPPAVVATGAATVLLPIVLLAAALRRAAAEWRAGVPAQGRTELLFFLALLAAGALRGGLGRSDLIHLLPWAALSGFGALALVGGDWLTRWAGAPRRAVPLLAGVALGLAAIGLQAQGPRRLAEHLAANPPQGECAEVLLTPSEAAVAYNRDYLAAACATERILRAHGIERLLTDHAAPWLYARFGMPLPSPYYSFNRAFRPLDQQRLIADVQASGVQALLHVRNFGAVRSYDVPNAARVPIVAAYLRGRGGAAAQVATPLGELTLWNEPDGPRLEPAPRPRPLPRPDGAQWRDLAAQVAAAEQLGRDERRRALGE